MSVLLVAASVLAGITCLIHIVLGGRDVVRPLLSSSLGEDPKFTLYLCWHMATIVLAGLSICFLLPALGWASRDLAWLATVASLLFAGWTGAMIALFRLPPLMFPQWAFFAPLAALGGAALL